MANQTDDSSNTENSISYIDKLADVKKNLDAKAGGDSSEFVDEDKDIESNDDEASDDLEVNDDDDESNSGGNDGGSDDDQDEDENESNDDAKDTKLEFRFGQFKGDGTQESYIKNLEEGYKNSSQEAIRIKDEKDSYERQVNAIKEAATRDPEFGEKLLSLLKGNGGDSETTNSGQDSNGNPFLRDAETRWNQESEKEAKEFTDANPEVLIDPKINADVKKWMRVFSKQIFDDDGRLIKAGEAMEMAYRHLGLADKRKKTQDLVDGMKKKVDPTRTQKVKKTKSSNGDKGSKQFSNLTLDIASKMGISQDRMKKALKK